MHSKNCPPHQHMPNILNFSLLRGQLKWICETMAVQEERLLISHGTTEMFQFFSETKLPFSKDPTYY